MNKVIKLIEIDCFGFISFEMRVDFSDPVDQIVGFSEDIIELVIF